MHLIPRVHRFLFEGTALDDYMLTNICRRKAIEKQYGTWEAYFQTEFGLNAERLKALQNRYLE